MIIVLATLSCAETQLVFCGGTCLSQAYHIIDRMSEDVDFKVIVPAGMSRGRKDRILSNLKRRVVEALQGCGFVLEEGSLREKWTPILGHWIKWTSALTVTR
ncbi:MAG: nucleotidyl transferase AbiEii/AbiGii toxin family protein [Acidiferrobacter sp.]